MRIIATRFAKAVESQAGVRYAVTTIGDDPQKMPNLASLYVKLLPPDKRKLSQLEMIEATRKGVIPQFAGQNLRIAVSLVQPFSSGQANFPVMFQIIGPDMTRIAEYTDKLLQNCGRCQAWSIRTRR